MENMDVVPLNMGTIAARAGRSQEGLPALAISNGSTTFELRDDGNHAEAAAGARRIIDAIWLFLQDVANHRLAAQQPSGAGDKP